MWPLAFEGLASFLCLFAVPGMSLEISIHGCKYTPVTRKVHTLSRGERRFLYFKPSFQRISGTNDTSFESLNTGHLEFAQKLGVASS